MNSLQLYFRYVGLSLRSQLQYRASFVMLVLSNLFMVACEFWGLTALFGRFGNIRGWRLSEIALFYGVMQVSYALVEGGARGFDTFGRVQIRSGNFDRLLVRPRSTLLQVAASEVQLMRMGRLLIGLLVLGWAVTQLSVAWNLAKVALLGFAILGGATVFYGLLILQATLAFWTVESLEIMNILTFGGTEAGQYPLTIYQSWLRSLFTFVVPLACANYLPLGLFFGESHAGIAPQKWHYFSPLIGLLFLWMTTHVWKWGEKHYVSAGG